MILLDREVMAQVVLSEGEKLFIQHSVQDDCRVDGRRCNEARRMLLETNVTANCQGSSHVRIGSTDLLIGIKAQVEETDPDLPDQGKVEFSADCSANASPLFEGRGGEEIVDELVSVLIESFTPSLDLKVLSLVPGKSAWTLYVDILILEFSSKPNLFDAAGVGIIAALRDTKCVLITIFAYLNFNSICRIPNVTFDEEMDDLDVPEDPSNVVTIDTSRLPILVSLTRISSKYVIDVTENEEAASISSVVVAIDPTGSVTYWKKISSGTLFAPQLNTSLKLASDRGMILHSDLLNVLKIESEIKSIS